VSERKAPPCADAVRKIVGRAGREAGIEEFNPIALRAANLGILFDRVLVIQTWDEIFPKTGNKRRGPLRANRVYKNITTL
jgi:hypothetical protein